MAGAVLQLLLLILGVFIYMPFIKMMDKQYLEDEPRPPRNQMTMTLTLMTFPLTTCRMAALDGPAFL